MSQTFLQRLKKNNRKNMHHLSPQMQYGIKVRRIYAVFEGRITDPEKIEQIEGRCKAGLGRFYGKKSRKVVKSVITCKP
jgi:hypothetical protein